MESREIESDFGVDWRRNQAEYYDRLTTVRGLRATWEMKPSTQAITLEQYRAAQDAATLRARWDALADLRRAGNATPEAVAEVVAKFGGQR
jgi:hypothetical protein